VQLRLPVVEGEVGVVGPRERLGIVVGEEGSTVDLPVDVLPLARDAEVVALALLDAES